MKKKQKSVKRGKEDFVDLVCMHTYQQAYSESGFYPPVENRDWTTSFWTGEIWLAYEFCGDERLKKAGEIQVHDFLERIDKKISVDHHDMGFLYSPSCVAAYKLIGSKEGREAEYYKGLAAKLMKSVYDNYAVKDFEISNGLVLHSTYSNHSPYNTCEHKGVDECNAWGDYFYMEALIRMEKDWTLYR